MWVIKSILCVALAIGLLQASIASDSNAPGLTQKMLRHSKAIKVMSVSQELSSNDLEVEVCKDFTMTKAQIVRFLRKARAIDAHDWHYQVDIAPCKITGQVKIDHMTADYYILATYAGEIWLSSDNANDRLKLNCTEKCEKAVFGANPRRADKQSAIRRS